VSTTTPAGAGKAGLVIEANVETRRHGLRRREAGGHEWLARRFRRCGLGLHGLGAPLQHALADVILERQRAHLEPLGVLLGAARVEVGAGLRRGGRGGRGHLLDAAHRLRSHRQDLDAAGARLGRDHDGVVAEGLADQAKGLARRSRGEAFDVHAVSRRQWR
jgi:hypothetical protein